MLPAGPLTAMNSAGISGSALADAAGPGTMMIRMMEKGGYGRAYAGALTISSSVVGPIIPPSITMIIYAMQDQQVSVGSLFMAGVLPGVLITLAVLVANARVSHKRGYASGAPMPPLAEIARIALYALPALMLVVLIVGGIRFGVFTPTEASVIAVFYALFVGMFIYRSLHVADLLVHHSAQRREAGLNVGDRGEAVVPERLSDLGGVDAPLGALGVALR